MAEPEPHSSAVCQAKPPFTSEKFQALNLSKRTSLESTVHVPFDPNETPGGHENRKLSKRALVFEGKVTVELVTLLRFQSPTLSQVGPIFAV